MYDLLKPEEQQRLTLFWNACLKTAAEREPVQRQFDALRHEPFDYSPGSPPAKIASGDKKIVIVTDAEAGGNLQGMVARLRECFAPPAEVVNLHKIKMLGGCMGCIQCGLDNVCFYRDADDVYGVYQKLAAADIVIQAATIRDRSLSAPEDVLGSRILQQPRPHPGGKQSGYVISGCLRQLPHLREILEASAQFQLGQPGRYRDRPVPRRPRAGRPLGMLPRRLMECQAAGY